MKLTRQISRTVIVATVALVTGSVARAAEDGNTEVKQALDMMEGQNPREAVALLAETARKYPQNRNVGHLLYTLLRDRNWPMPQTLPVKMSGEVTALAFNSDGLKLMAGSADGTVRILDGEKGEFTEVTVKHSAAVVALKMGPKDEAAVSVSLDGLVQIWDPKTGKILQTIRNEGHKLSAGAATPDLKLIALGYEDGQVIVYSRETGKPLGQPLKHDKAVRDLVFSRDDTTLASASEDGTARVWDVATMKPRDFVVKHKAPLVDVDIGRLGILLLTASKDGILQIHDAHTGKALVSDINCGSPILNASFGTSGIFATTVLADHTVRVWDTATGQEVEGIIRTDDGIRQAVWGPGGMRILTMSDTTKATLWRARDGVRVSEDMLHAAPLRVIAFSPFGRFLGTGTADGSVRIWRQDIGATANAMPTVFQHFAPARTAFITADAKGLVTAADDLTAVRWTRGSMKATGRPMVHDSKVACAVLNKDSSTVATIAEDGKVSFWNGKTNARLGEPHDVGAPGRWIDFHPDGKRVVATAGAKAMILSVDDGKTIGKPIEHPEQAKLNHARFSPDGKWIVTASDDKTACIWETETGKLVATLKKHEEAVLAARFSPDGKRVVTGGGDGALIVWDTATWQQTGETGSLPGAVYSALISPDNEFVVATSANANGVGFFHIASGRMFSQVVQLSTDANSVDLDAKGDVLVVACQDGTIRAYGSPFVQEDVPKWVPDFAERLVGMRKNGDDFALVDAKYADLKSESEKLGADDQGDFAKLARWSLSAGADRTGMPRTVTKIADIVAKRVDERSLDALYECFDADPEDALIFAALSLFVPTKRQGEFFAEFVLQHEGISPIAKAYVASTFAKYERLEEAERVMKEALAAAPNDPRVLRRAAKLDVRQNRKQATIEKLDRAIAADPEDEITYRDYGWMMYNLNDPAKAIEQFKKAEELSGGADTDVNSGMALALAAMKDQAGSTARYKRLIKIGAEWGQADYLKSLQGWSAKELAEMERIRLLATKP